MKRDKSSAKSEGSVNFLWSNYHSYLSDVVRQLHNEESLLDVTLCVDGERIQAHRLVLCSCSSLFQNILSQVTDEHTTIILSDVASDDVKSIVEFCYNGEIRVPVESINSLLETAHSLKIFGLMEIPSLTDSLDKEEHSDETSYDEYMGDENDDSEQPSTDKLKVDKKRSSIDKKECSGDLKNALAELSKGMSIIEASTKYRVSRHKLYAKAKKCRIALTPAKINYTIENIRAAIKDVIAGSSLQQAAICHGIPKTVLWRRLQKEGGPATKSLSRKSYLSETREAAVKALERGEGLTKVSQEYKIPKTTLFRDKTKLVSQGKLPEASKKRSPEDEEAKNEQLEKAVAACRSGTMSQASAAAMFKVPKTTIWRHLHHSSKKVSPSTKILCVEGKSEKKVCGPKTALDSNKSDFEVLQEENDSIVLNYVDDDMSDDQVIILAENTDGLNLQNSTSLIVVQDSDDNFIHCGLELDEDENFSPKS